MVQINTTPRGTEFAEANGFIFVNPQDIDTNGLWRTDGTQANTQKIREFGTTGCGHTCDTPNIWSIIGTERSLFFIARETGFGPYRWWASDGTITGTIPLTQNETNNTQQDHEISAHTDGYEQRFWSSDNLTAPATPLAPDLRRHHDSNTHRSGSDTPALDRTTTPYRPYI